MPPARVRRLTLLDTITETIPGDESQPRRLVRVTDGRWLGGVLRRARPLFRRQPARLPDRVRRPLGNAHASGKCGRSGIRQDPEATLIFDPYVKLA